MNTRTKVNASDVKNFSKACEIIGDEGRENEARALLEKIPPTVLRKISNLLLTVPYDEGFSPTVLQVIDATMNIDSQPAKASILLMVIRALHAEGKATEADLMAMTVTQNLIESEVAAIMAKKQAAPVQVA